ncbi:hypothetical protein Pmar_PMAR002115 [Perkinsus marinus ATCC 50983]|uniref:Uncharacterized protein n=1 Tax=Perkinsus marinus (strain ATCC 50983 / TXsc) TaxID=423536 RepID=C5KLF6_PERM5|nr:hypothetical protein Pmar_PMAR002115 [Perkinsus marinus ATCC 50983]EER14685.1 hypothetical protein Pmar_PMAR002115 [Perkinsus marinus ATCC 50983]|eukprot:XP_002782889.1 hypothetical protein Pmar_PMAR002115 [Perkinsus marinus ATCC 50983]
MVPDAGSDDAVFASAVIAPIVGVDLGMEMQRLYLEVEKRDAFNKKVSIMRAKLQRWASKTGIVDVEEKARVIYGAVIDAAQVEGMSGEWINFLAKHLAKQVIVSIRSQGIEWPINRHEDLHNALELFLVGKTGEMGSGDGSGGGVKAGGSRNDYKVK